MWQWLRHAFAVNEEAPELTSEEANELESLATQVVRRGMATPAVTFLEMSRPLNYLGAQVLHFFSPMISAVTTSARHEHLARLLERRDVIDRLIARIEELDAANRQPPDDSKSPPPPAPE